MDWLLKKYKGALRPVFWTSPLLTGAVISIDIITMLEVGMTHLAHARVEVFRLRNANAYAYLRYA